MNTHAGSYTLSVPSWVIAGTYAENLRFLEQKKEITGVELLFFLYDNEVKNQLDSEWDEILSFAKRFVFTAHLPELLSFAEEPIPAYDELVARLAPLVRHFIVHPSDNPSIEKNHSAFIKLLAECTNRYGASFLVENTNPGLLDAMLPFLEPDAGLCMDTGHLLLEGKNPADFFTRYRERIKEIHLHGIDRKQAAVDGKLIDHRQLKGDEKWLLELLPLLEDYCGVINLEVFSWEEARYGIEVLMRQCFNKIPIDKSPQIKK